MDLFTENQKVQTSPLPEELRPDSIESFEFDETGEAQKLFKAWSNHKFFSFILYGAPGIGKSSLMELLYKKFSGDKHKINAVDINVAKLRQISKEAEDKRVFNGSSTLLLVDEAHRLTSAQQDALLPSLEKGSLILAGATTENPHFTFGRAFLSRLTKVKMKPLSKASAQRLLERGFESVGMKGLVSEAFQEKLILSALGDGRKLLASVQNVAQLFLSQGSFDEEGALKYLDFETSKASKTTRSDALSALIKTMRASDEKAAVYYLGLLLKSKEDPVLIFRRLFVFCSEDVGNADPQAAVLIASLSAGFEKTGLPEGLYALYQAVSYLSKASKSRRHALQIKWVRDHLVENPEEIEIPAHLRAVEIEPKAKKAGALNLPEHLSEI